MKNNFKLGPISSFRLFPDKYNSFTAEEKRICDEEFLNSVSDNTKKHRNLYYFAEIIYHDSEYESITASSPNKEFIDKANLIHKYKYDYSLVNYLNSRVHIDIKCPIHGVFHQRPTNHLQGQGCAKCSIIEQKKNKAKSVTYNNMIFEEKEVKTDKEVKTEKEVLYSDEFKEFLKLIENK